MPVSQSELDYLGCMGLRDSSQVNLIYICGSHCISLTFFFFFFNCKITLEEIMSRYPMLLYTSLPDNKAEFANTLFCHYVFICIICKLCWTVSQFESFLLQDSVKTHILFSHCTADVFHKRPCRKGVTSLWCTINYSCRQSAMKSKFWKNFRHIMLSVSTHSDVLCGGEVRLILQYECCMF